MKLVKLCYRLSLELPDTERYSLIFQIRKSSLSVISNIAEGLREITLERKRFYEISRSSVVELDTQIEVAKSLGFIECIPEELDLQINQIFAMLSKMLNPMRLFL